GIDGASVFMSASEEHNKSSINKTIDETFPVLKEVIHAANRPGKHVPGYVSPVFASPFAGRVTPEPVIRVCDELLEFGVDDLSLGDTIGTAVPSRVNELLDVVLKRYPKERIIMQYHDTRGMAIANIMTSMEYGITRFDSSLGGLGG